MGTRRKDGKDGPLELLCSVGLVWLVGGCRSALRHRVRQHPPVEPAVHPDPQAGTTRGNGEMNVIQGCRDSEKSGGRRQNASTLFGQPFGSRLDGHGTTYFALT